MTQKLPNNYIMIEFHEKDTNMPQLDNWIITSELISYLKALDNFFKQKLGYYKFYFYDIENGEKINHFRMDIGDGYQANKEIYDYLEKKVAPSILYGQKGASL